MKVQLREQDLSDDYLRFAAQVGADGIDVIRPEHVPGVSEQGYADAPGLRALMDRVRRFGLEVYRVHPPTPGKYLLGHAGGEAELDNLCRTLEAFGRARVPYMYAPIELSHEAVYRDQFSNVGHLGIRAGVHRTGYTMLSFYLEQMRRNLATQPPDLRIDPEAHFERSVRMYERLLPIAEAYDVRLITHPTDPPLPEAPFAPQRWARILELVPSTHSGFLYCVGTRYETGVDVCDDIRVRGRQGKIFQVDFRNVRGTIPASGGYAEVGLADGDMNMARVLRALKSVGYDGGLAVDHLPDYTGDNRYQGMASAYAVGYVKALIAAMEASAAAPR